MLHILLRVSLVSFRPVQLPGLHPSDSLVLRDIHFHLFIRIRHIHFVPILQAREEMMSHEVLHITIDAGSGRMQVYTEIPKRFERNISQIVQRLRHEVLGENAQGSLERGNLFGDGIFHPFLIQFFVDVLKIQCSLKELGQ